MSEISELQEHLNVLKKQVELKQAVEYLLNNDQFNKVIIEGFCRDEMQRNMSLAVCEKLPADVRELCNQMAKASATLHNYLQTVIQLGTNAEEDMKEVDEKIQYLETHEGEE